MYEPVSLLSSRASHQLKHAMQLSFDPWNADIHAFKVKHIYERLRQDEEASNTLVQCAHSRLNSDSALPQVCRLGRSD